MLRRRTEATFTTRCTKDGCKPGKGQRMSGAGLSGKGQGRAPSEMPAFQPYWGKPAVRNDRGDRGDVGIIRSPVRASILPACGGRPVMAVPTAIQATGPRDRPLAGSTLTLSGGTSREDARAGIAAASRRDAEQ